MSVSAVSSSTSLSNHAYYQPIDNGAPSKSASAASIATNQNVAPPPPPPPPSAKSLSVSPAASSNGSSLASPLKTDLSGLNTPVSSASPSANTGQYNASFGQGLAKGSDQDGDGGPPGQSPGSSAPPASSPSASFFQKLTAATTSTDSSSSDPATANNNPATPTDQYAVSNSHPERSNGGAGSTSADVAAQNAATQTADAIDNAFAV